MDATLIYYAALKGLGSAGALAAVAAVKRTPVETAVVKPLPVVHFDFQPLRDAILMYEIALGAALTISAAERRRRRARVLACVSAMP